MKVLSLFDGMACGMIAMQLAGIEVESYDAYEIDKYAIKTAQHNFPMIKEHGDVFGADFTQYEGVDILIGGSPCTYWSIAQTKNRETVASGMGWELFSQYVRALHEAKPKYFIYENNKSMSKDIRASIDEAFGFEAICINSALVSAQNRQRLYWVGKRNDDGTYSKVLVEQPEDRGILLRDILETGVCWREKSCTLDANYYKGGNLTSLEKQSGHRLMAAEPINTTSNGKARTLIAGYHKQGIENCCGSAGFGSSGVAEPIEPRCVAQRGRYPENPKARVAGLPTEQMFEAREDGKTNTLTTVQKDNLVAEPVNITKDEKAQCLRATYYKDGIRNMVGNDVDRKTCVAEPVRIGTIENDAKNPTHDSQQYRVYSCDGKSVTLCGNGGGLGAKTGLYAVPYDCDVVITENSIRCQRRDQKHSTVQGSHVNFSDGKSQTLSPSHIPNVIEPKSGKTHPVYEVRNGLITIKGKQYPIKLEDGYYIIRKLTVRECMRLQTVPEWYEFPVSDSQAYKMLGNGWTVDVIAHILKGLKEA